LAEESLPTGARPGDPAAHGRFGDLALGLAPLCSAGDRAAADFAGAAGPIPRWLSFLAEPGVLAPLRALGFEPERFGPPPGAGADLPPGAPLEWAGLWTSPETFEARLAGLGASERARLAPLREALRAASSPRPRTRLMAVLNATPDSFSDGGRLLRAGHLDVGRARDLAHALVAAGAECLDVGGESTRPGATPVEAAEEWGRVGPLLEALEGRLGAVELSIDTQKSEVAERALDRGATWINDVSAGEHDPRMLSLAARRGCKLVLMHRQGEPRSMQIDPRYVEPVFEVASALRRRARAALEAGVREERLLLDPGLGFGKRLEHNLALLARLAELRSLGQPLLVGASRKSFLGRLSGRTEAAERLPESLAAACVAALGGADWVRVHDVAETRAALSLIAALRPAEGPRRWN
jgi:dihydropteroate synthase